MGLYLKLWILVLSVEKNMTVLCEENEESTYLPLHNLKKKSEPKSTPSGRPDSSIHSSPLYIFEEGEGIHARDSGAPEIAASLHASFEAEPARLQALTTEYMETRCERRGGFEVKCSETCVCFWSTSPISAHEVSRRCWISYLQLPLGVAGPYIAEMEPEAF